MPRPPLPLPPAPRPPSLAFSSVPPPPPPPPPLDALAAPQPHRYSSTMARTLDDQLQINRTTTPGSYLPSPVPPPGAQWNPWSIPARDPSPNPDFYPASPTPPYPSRLQFPSNPTLLNNYESSPPPRSRTLPNPPGAILDLTAPLPNIPNLTAALNAIQQPNQDPSVKIAWARDVVFLVDRLQPSSSSSTDPQKGPARIADPQLLRLSHVAVQVILQVASAQPISDPTPPWLAEAFYLKATFECSGAFPDVIPLNPRSAFRGFETAARAGYAQAWFRLGRDYENFKNYTLARECFERGVKLNVEGCCYRMGMANLLGQLDLPVSPDAALPLLLRAALLASLQVPQPAYIYSLLLLNEFSHATIPPPLLSSLVPPSSTPLLEARKHLERAAYLNYAPAQYKLGHAYEFAQPPFPFDPLLSVQYYSFASQQGEAEADMALSKWFLCGAEGAFEKDEGLAYTFADKAARKGLPNGEFAMGYYAEVGVGRPSDLEVARKWYTRASDHGNTDATERLAALSRPAPQSLSRQEHDNITQSKLVRKRTQAKERSEGAPPPSPAAVRQQDGDSPANGRFSPNDGRGAPAGYVDPQSLSPKRRPLAAAESPLTPSPSGSRLQQPEARPRPVKDSQRAQFAGQRYSLVDPGSGSASTSLLVPDNTNSPPRPGRPPRRPSPATVSGNSPPSQDSPIAAARPPPKGPATFAEMGFQGAKAEDKDCIIM